MSLTVAGKIDLDYGLFGLSWHAAVAGTQDAGFELLDEES